ncbi:MAG: macro domain-containing protein [Kofleriaceae bacterium]
MGIERGHGNLLTADVEALVNPVNTVGVMGKGLALQFREAFPEAFTVYAQACKVGEVVVGRMHIVQRQASPRIIVNFPTKEHWRRPSQLAYVRDGLRDLILQIQTLRIRSIAVPPLGCGNGGLDWAEVKPLIVAAFAEVPDVRAVVFEPGTSTVVT